MNQNCPSVDWAFQAVTLGWAVFTVVIGALMLAYLDGRFAKKQP